MSCLGDNLSGTSSVPSGIINNDQGYFRNQASKTISDLPVVYLAYLTNDNNSQESDVTINLNNICLNWCDFLVLFFRSPGGAFWVNPSNASSSIISLYDQTYETTQKKCVRFNLADQIVKAWSKKNSKPEITVPPSINILLNRAGFLTKSLATIKDYTIGLSLDEVMSTLLSTNRIVPADSDSKATVKFIVTYRDYFQPLDISVAVNFTYITQIPCYKNTSDCDEWCPYSGDDTGCRPCLDNARMVSDKFFDDMSLPSIFTQHNNMPKMYAQENYDEKESQMDDNKSVTSANENTIVSSNENTSEYLVQQIQNLITSDKSVASSKW